MEDNGSKVVNVPTNVFTAISTAHSQLCLQVCIKCRYDCNSSHFHLNGIERCPLKTRFQMVLPDLTVMKLQNAGSP